MLQTRVPVDFYNRIKQDAADRKMSLSKYLVMLLDEYATPAADLTDLKDQWKEDGWIECAAWILVNFRDQRFCNIDLDRLTRLLQGDEARWLKIRQAIKILEPDSETLESGAADNIGP